MVCLGLKPGAAGWKARMNTLSYSGTPISDCYPTAYYEEFQKRLLL